MPKTNDTLLGSAAPADTDAKKVRNWRAQIRRARAKLRIAERAGAAKDARRFVYTPPEGSKIEGELDLKYGLPILEQSFARAAQKVTPPTVIADADVTEVWEEMIRRFLAMQFRIGKRALKRLGIDVQWDDAGYGNFVAKAEWSMSLMQRDPEAEMDIDLRAMQIERAMGENADPHAAKIATDDAHLEHLSEHVPYLSAVAADEDMTDALEAHIRDHQAQLTVTISEGVKPRRVNPAQYVYDPDNPWEDRAWEAELETVRVLDLKAPHSGYRNITSKILQPYIPSEKGDSTGFAGKMPAETLYVNVWHIHDRRENKLYTIADKDAAGGDDKFLRKREWPFPCDIYYLDRFRPFSADLTYGEATLLSLQPILRELAVVQFHINRHVQNHSTSKFFAVGGAGASALKGAVKNPDQWWVEGSPEQISLVKWMQPPPIPETLLRREAELINEIYRQVQADAQDIGAPHAHQMTAQESGRREFTAETRVASRQQVIADMFTWYARTLLKMYKAFATMEVPVNITTPSGEAVEKMDPAEIPDAFEIYVDVNVESDQLKALKLEGFLKYYELWKLSQQPMDDRQALADMGQLLGVDASRWRAKGEAGPDNVETPPGPSGSLPGDRPAMNAPAVQTSQSAVQAGKRS